MENDERVSTYIDSETKKKVRMAAGSEDVSMAEWLRRAIENELERSGFEGNLNQSEQPAD
jgi:hypothetical protein